MRKDTRKLACDVFKSIDYNKDKNKFSLIEAVHVYMQSFDIFDEVDDKDEKIEKEVRVYLKENGYIEALNAFEGEDTWDYRLKQKGVDVFKKHAGDLIEYEEHQLFLKEQMKEDEKKHTKRFWIPVLLSAVAVIISLIPMFKDNDDDSIKEEIKKLQDENIVLKTEVKLLNHRLLQIEQKDIVQINKKADLK